MFKRDHIMVFLLVLFCSTIFFPLISFAEEFQYDFVVVNCFPHDPKAFTQGLIFYDGFLYEGTGLYGHSSLRKTVLEKGTILAQTVLDQEFFGEGVTIFNDKIYQLTWKEERGFVYDLASLEKIDEFDYKGEGWGLTTDSQYLIISDGSHVLTFLDPETYQLVKRLEVVGKEGLIKNLNELEYINGEILANIWFDHRICRIDTESGKVLGWIDLTDLYNAEKRNFPDIDVLNGIAYNSHTGNLYITGKLWRNVYEISLTQYK